MTIRLLVAGGGTGGHLYPGIAVAREAVRAGGEALFIGTEHGIEARVLPREGFGLVTIRAGKYMGMGIMDKARTLAGTPFGVRESVRAIRAFRPDAALGVGGYASFPALVGARLLDVPVVIQEQNAYPGLTNTILGRFADAVALGFREGEGFFPKGRTVFTGNPVRAELFAAVREDSCASFGLDQDRLTVLVFGGSAGAQRINRGVANALARLGEFRDLVQFIHQTGERDHKMVETAYSDNGFRAAVMPFIYDMASAYACTDFAVCRSGALTLAELTALGLPAILIPYPHATGNHQEVNARAVEKAGAAKVVLDSEADGETLTVFMGGLIRDPELLADMAAKSRALGMPDAASRVYGLCVKAAGRGVTQRAATR